MRFKMYGELPKNECKSFQNTYSLKQQLSVYKAHPIVDRKITFTWYAKHQPTWSVIVIQKSDESRKLESLEDLDVSCITEA